MMCITMMNSFPLVNQLTSSVCLWCPLGAVFLSPSYVLKTKQKSANFAQCESQVYALIKAKDALKYVDSCFCSLY